MTSEWEGFGLVAIEALSLGVPVVMMLVDYPELLIINAWGALCKTR